MHSKTEANLKALREVEWFRNVGVRDTEVADVLSSWDEAIESCSSPDWENLCIGAANLMRQRLVQRSMERFREWNDVVAMLKPVVVPLVEEKIEAVVARNGLSEQFFFQVRWDILHLCIQSEYADLLEMGFYSGQAHWYWSGHFPCGWRGQFPTPGRLVIY